VTVALSQVNLTERIHASVLFRPRTASIGFSPCAFWPPVPLASNRIRSYTRIMSTKEAAIHTRESLPDDVTWDDIVERINSAAGVRRGLKELDKGQGVPHQQVTDGFQQWLLG